VESQIIPDIAVDAANPKNSVRVSDEGLASGGRPLYCQNPCIHLCNSAFAAVS